MPIINIGLVTYTFTSGVANNGGVVAATVGDSITVNNNLIELVGDQASPGVSMVYGTDAGGNKGWQAVGGSTAQATGQTLYGYIVGLSGASASTYATIINLQTTGNTLYNLLVGASGLMATVTNLFSTGSNLYNDILGLSGVLNTSGTSLYGLITGVSGYDKANYATIANLQLTGQTLYQDILSVSGLVAGAGGVSSLNGVSGIMTLTSSGYITFQTGVGNITLGVTGLTPTAVTTGMSGALNTTIQNTGQTLYQDLTNASGLFATIVLVTGMSGQANTNYATVANLQTTGSNLYVTLTGLSGAHNIVITATGATLYNDLVGLSGALGTALATTGSNLYNDINNLSGVMTGQYVPTGSFATLAGLNIENFGVYATGTASPWLVTLDFAGSGLLSVPITGNTIFTGINQNPNSTKVVRMIGGGSTYNLTFPGGWIWLGTAGMPASLASTKTAVLSLTVFATGGTGVIAAYAAQS